MKIVVLASLLPLACAVACDSKETPTAAPAKRSDSLIAEGTAAAVAPPTAAPIATAAAPAAARPVLCAGQLGKAGKDTKDAPEEEISRAGDKSRVPEKLQTGGGKWTWINLWAAWCVPCKEEIPRLKAWEQKAAGEPTGLRVTFVSLDDDERQLETFLGAQPPGGLRSTYWLKDGRERTAWLKAAGLDGEPELPAHILVDPSGKVRCRQRGAIEDADFPELLAMLRGQRTTSAR